jgi:hypothetical protein
LRKFPGLPEAERIRTALDENLASDRIAKEVAYFGQPNRKSFERTYGWAWLLGLSAELKSWDDAKARTWAAQLQPLADTVAKAFADFLPRQDYPIRTGVHPNTAYSLSHVLDYATAAHDEKLAALVKERALTYFEKDYDAPLRWEPGGEDFLSPSLEEATLMARVLPGLRFRRWVGKFLPDLLDKGQLAPAKVSDRTDPKIVHLDGLNLSRAHCLFSLAKVLTQKRAMLVKLAEEHANATLPHVESGSYEGEHWLATFAVRMMDSR